MASPFPPSLGMIGAMKRAAGLLLLAVSTINAG
jgi:hypothetical protein